MLEMFGDKVKPCYYTLANSMGFKYGCLQCEIAGANLRVDIQRVEHLLQTLNVAK